MSSSVAGFVGALVTTPADVVKSRVINQPVDDTGRGVRLRYNGWNCNRSDCDLAGLYYRGSLHCARVVLRDEGLRGLYSGFGPMWLRLGPWVTIFWLTNEQLRRVAGQESW